MFEDTAGEPGPLDRPLAVRVVNSATATMNTGATHQN